MEILSVLPNGIEKGWENHITIAGEGFTDGSTVSISGTGATVGNVVFLDDETITADVDVAPWAEIGLRDVSVTPSGGSPVTLTASLAITNFQSLTRQLRMMTGERILPGQTDADTNFTDDELIDLILQAGGNLFLASSNIWQAKAAEAASLVDITESGSERKLSQLYKNATAQRDSYATAGEQLEKQLLEPVVGTTANWLWGGDSSTRMDWTNDPFHDPFLFLFFRYSWMPLTPSPGIASASMGRGPL